jgi:hypothetical protein
MTTTLPLICMKMRRITVSLSSQGKKLNWISPGEASRVAE